MRCHDGTRDISCRSGQKTVDVRTGHWNQLPSDENMPQVYQPWMIAARNVLICIKCPDTRRNNLLCQPRRTLKPHSPAKVKRTDSISPLPLEPMRRANRKLPGCSVRLLLRKPSMPVPTCALTETKRTASDVKTKPREFWSSWPIYPGSMRRLTAPQAATAMVQVQRDSLPQGSRRLVAATCLHR